MNTHSPKGPGLVPRQVPHLPSGVPAGWQVAPRTPNDVTAELAGGGYLVRLTVGHNQLTLNRPEVEAIIERLEAALPRLPIELAPR